MVLVNCYFVADLLYLSCSGENWAKVYWFPYLLGATSRAYEGWIIVSKLQQFSLLRQHEPFVLFVLCFSLFILFPSISFELFEDVGQNTVKNSVFIQKNQLYVLVWRNLNSVDISEAFCFLFE